ncbi:hypothetical protein EOD41_10010 [Mucilaginibacter limnophilus]|uniref:Uncharacterized protein n=1 Tax=Mucilaginibacter limnophilus TaxID=1932778 RepID=A0A437MTG8_9SPHI|nr:hypothetical protein EOD41_10010 [Mucilaginibacter limnophilus]
MSQSPPDLYNYHKSQKYFRYILIATVGILLVTQLVAQINIHPIVNSLFIVIPFFVVVIGTITGFYYLVMSFVRRETFRKARMLYAFGYVFFMLIVYAFTKDIVFHLL